MPIPKLVNAIDHRRMRNLIYTTLLQWIIDGVLLPGEIIIDSELAKSLGVSRTPVREAIQKLEDEGFIEIKAHKWTRVSPIRTEQLSESIPIIAELEALAIQLAENQQISIPQKQLKKATSRMQKAIEEGRFLDAYNRDVEFHKILASTAGNTQIVAFLDVLRMKLKRIDLIYFKGGISDIVSCQEHQQIIDYLTLQDFDRVRNGIRAHWMNGLNRLDALKRKLTCEESFSLPGG